MAHPSRIIAFLIFAVKICDSELSFKLRSKRTVNEDPRNNIHGIVEKGYYIETLIGTPPQRLNILIDTGSSNFAVASRPSQFISKYFHSANSTTVQSTDVSSVNIRYTEGNWKGPLVRDFVSIPQANMTRNVRVEFVEIEESKKFFLNESGWQGILGMAYDDIIRPADSNVKSFASSVLGKGNMKNVFSLKLCGADVRSLHNRVSGTFILGGYDRSLDQIHWTPIVREWYYDVRVLGMKVGNTSIDIACNEFNNDKSIVDSGTTNIRLPTKIFDIVVNAMKNYVHSKTEYFDNFESFWNGKSDLCWKQSEDPYALFPEITVYLPSSEHNYTITLHVYPEHYILFRFNKTVNSENLACYKFGISPSDTGTVLGAVLMEQYNVIFDRANKRIGFAKSDCSPTSFLSYTPGYINSTDCAYIANSGLSATQIVAYILLGLVLLCTLPVCILMCTWFRKKKRLPSNSDSEMLMAR